MMYWSERHGQLLQDDVLAVLFVTMAVIFFVVHHILPAEEPLLETAEISDELERLRKSEGRARSLREALFIVDTDANRPAVFAAFSDKNRSLLVHRKRLTRARGCVFVNFLLVLPLVIEMLIDVAAWQDWLLYGSFTYQVIFAVAAGHYANLLWEDLDSCGNFLPGISRLATRSRGEKLATLLVSWVRNAACFAAFLMGAMIRLPGLGLLTLLWEAPSYLTLYREAWTSANQLSYWLLDETALWQFWRPMLLLLVVVRLPLTLLLVSTSFYLEIAEDAQRPETLVRVGYHVIAAILIIDGLWLVPVLMREYRADRALAVKMRELGWPGGVAEQHQKARPEAETSNSSLGKKQSISRLFSFKGIKSGNSGDEVLHKPDEFEDAGSVLPVCQLSELPSVPKEQDINMLNSIYVQSVPRRSQSEA